jgi:hypothetical protein
MHTDAFHHSLALIDYLAPIVPRVAAHDRKLARALRRTATAMPLRIAAGEPERAHLAAGRVHVMLTMAQAWGYVHDDDIAEALHTARVLHEVTAP